MAEKKKCELKTGEIRAGHNWDHCKQRSCSPSPCVVAWTKSLHSPGTLEKALTLNWYSVLPLSAVTSLVVLTPSSVSTQGWGLPWPTGWYSIMYLMMPPLGSSGGCHFTWMADIDRGRAWTLRGDDGPERRINNSSPGKMLNSINCGWSN